MNWRQDIQNEDVKAHRDITISEVNDRGNNARTYPENNNHIYNRTQSQIIEIVRFDDVDEG